MNPQNQPKAFSIAQFCADHGISKSMYYLLLKQGRAPRVMKCGKRSLISAEAAADWRKQMEAGQNQIAE